MYIYIYTYTHIYTHIYINTHIHVYIYTHTYIYIDINIYVHVYIYIYTRVYLHKHIYVYIYCYAPMYQAGLQGAVCSHQVCQLISGTDIVVWWTLFKVTDITNSQAEPHFKATGIIIGEILRVNIANWLAFLLKYKAFNKYNSSQ